MLLTGTPRILLSVVALLLIGSHGSNAQLLPADARAWQVVKILIQETGSPSKTVDRQAFRVRLAGELAGVDPETFRDTWPMYADVKIDTLLPLAPLLHHIPAIPKQKIPARTDTIERAVVYATTFHGGIYDNAYFFLENDSIWRLVAWRQFPSDVERGRIVEAIDRLDTASPSYIPQRIALTRLLGNDNAQISLFKRLSVDADDVAGPLSRTEVWRGFDLGAIAYDSIDEYGGLDDDLADDERLIHVLNVDALARLTREGISRITNVSPENGIVRFEIGSFGGEGMGFLFVPEQDAIPTITPERYYLLKPIAPRWYYYKGFVDALEEPENPGDASGATDTEPTRSAATRRSSAPSEESERKSPLLRPKSLEQSDDE